MSRPELKLTSTQSEKILISWSAYLVVVLFIINGLEWFIHKDVVSSWISKYKMLLLSAFGLMIALGGHYLVKYPQHFNYRVEITEENAAYQYKKTILSLRWLIIFILSVMVGFSIKNIVDKLAFSPLVQVVNFLPVVVILCYMMYIFLYLKAKKLETKA